MLKKNKYCCSAHVDMAFDDYLLENETFPYLEKVSENEINSKCNYCEKIAIYKLCDNPEDQNK